MDVFQALADPVRRSLLRTVSGAPARVTDLAGGFDISRPAVSRHLRVLAEAGLVEAVAQGRERHFAARPEALAPVSSYLADLAELARPAGRLGPEALDALETEVRRTGRERRARERDAVTNAPPPEETSA